MAVTDELAARRRRSLASGVPLHNDPKSTPLPALVLPPVPDLSAWNGATSPTAAEAAELVAWIGAVRQWMIDLGQGVDDA